MKNQDYDPLINSSGFKQNEGLQIEGRPALSPGYRSIQRRRQAVKTIKILDSPATRRGATPSLQSNWNPEYVWNKESGLSNLLYQLPEKMKKPKLAT